MEVFLMLLGIVICLVGSFLFAGSETGFYTLSRTQLDVDAEGGSRPARLVQWLIRDDAALLITLLIGNNLVLELASSLANGVVERTGLSQAWTAAIVTVGLAPAVFLIGEALPKDLFHTRPQWWTYFAAPVIVVSRVAFYPLERILRGVSFVLERAAGLETESSITVPRERLKRILVEGERQGVLPERARILAENALALRSIPIERCMTPWDSVLVLDRGTNESELRSRVETSRFTRLPVMSEEGRFEGYVHQLEVLASPEGGVLGQIRPLPRFEPDLPVDRALLSLRASGKRAAVVGTKDKPVGLVTLKDLVEEISGDLTGI